MISVWAICYIVADLARYSFKCAYCLVKLGIRYVKFDTRAVGFEYCWGM